MDRPVECMISCVQRRAPWSMPTRSAARSLQHFNQVCCHPDVDLPERFFQPLFVIEKELSGLWRVRCINEYPNKFITVCLTLMMPQPVNLLGFRGNRTKPLFELEQQIRDQIVRPSLNRSGNRISKRRKDLLIRGWPLGSERDTLQCQLG